ncbi:hypothetical protein EDB84DRAFT_473839 [Lactarius hengduanensis]|nr:hypothetical protein EDB84DRAFT_473839 [Lactarius hengduanensis]
MKSPSTISSTSISIFHPCTGECCTSIGDGDAPPPRVPSPWHRSPSYSPSVLPAASYDAPASFPSWTRPAPISPCLDALQCRRATRALPYARALRRRCRRMRHVVCPSYSPLRSMCAVSALTLLAFNVELLPAAPLTDTLPYTLFENFLAVQVLPLPYFVGVPPAAHVVPPNAAPHLAVLDNSHGLAAALGSSHLLCRLTLRIASTLYDGLPPAPGGSVWRAWQHTERARTQTCAQCRHTYVRGNTGAGLEVLELSQGHFR